MKHSKHISLDRIADMSEQEITIDPDTSADLVYILHQIVPNLPLLMEERNNEVSLRIYLKKYSDGAFNVRIDDGEATS